MNFYTGLSSIKLFAAVYNHKTFRLEWYQENYKLQNTTKNIHSVKSKKIYLKEWVFTNSLMRLRLQKENIMENVPKIFRKARHSRLRVIIVCSEVFIERPKSVNAQAAMWSEYKFLIGISPTRFVTFSNFKLWKESIEEKNSRFQMFISWQSYEGLQITVLSFKMICKFFIRTWCSLNSFRKICPRWCRELLR